jgi:hypothetical protein
MRLFRLDDVLCLDYHDVVYHGRRQEYSIKVLKDGRKRRVFRYGVAGVGRRKMFYTSRIRPCKTGEDTGDIVRGLVWDQAPQQVLMDLFFGSVKVFDTVEALGREYVIPCKETDKMDELYKKSLLSASPISSAHDTERTASSGCVTGAPQSAMMPSPMNLSRVPSYLKSVSSISSKYSLSISTSSSGWLFSAIAV